MSTASSSKVKEYSFSFDGVSSGTSYRLYRKALLNEAAGTTDESGSSLADHYLDTDMGGAAAGAMPMPGGAAGQKFVRLQRSRRRCIAARGVQATAKTVLNDSLSLFNVVGFLIQKNL